MSLHETKIITICAELLNNNNTKKKKESKGFIRNECYKKYIVCKIVTIKFCSLKRPPKLYTHVFSMIV